jgi:predicted flap endonuclease-1-like 5' DNA nuclease
MKRIAGFLLGIGLGVLFAYLLRRYLLNQSSTEAVTIPPPNIEEPSTEPEIKPAATLIIRRNGPRPPALSSEDKGTHISVNGRSTENEISKPMAENVDPEVQVADAVIETPAQSELAASESPTSNQPDDFTIIIDIGPVFNRKLQDAGITSFTALSLLSAEEIAEKVGTNAARIERNKWREQAAQLASGTISVEAQRAENSEKAEG